VARLVTVRTVPKESQGLAQVPGAASEYQVAPPVADWVGAVVVVGASVVVVAGGGFVVVVVGAGLAVVVVVGGVGLVVVVGGEVVDVVAGGVVVADSSGALGRKCTSCTVGKKLLAPDAPTAAVTLGFCGAAAGTGADRSSRSGVASMAPPRSTPTAARRPAALFVLRTPPFSGDTGPAPVQDRFGVSWDAR